MAAAPQLEYRSVPPAMQAGYAGVYETADRPALTIVFEEDKLFARAGEDAWFRMYPASATEFFAIDSETRWTFVKDTNGRVTELVAQTGGVEVRRRRAE